MEILFGSRIGKNYENSDGLEKVNFLFEEKYPSHAWMRCQHHLADILEKLTQYGGQTESEFDPIINVLPFFRSCYE